MALITCKECKEKISNKAKKCPKCGAPVKKKTSLITWAVTVLIGLFLIGHFSKPDVDSPKTHNRPAATTADKTASLPNWQYTSTRDSMTDQTTYRAATKSLNAFNFKFPYRGEQHATLTLRTHPRYGKDIILTIERGQFLCSISGCNVLVRFDDSKPVRYSASEPSDHSTTTLFINDYSRFAGKMLKAKRLRIQAEFYQEGSRTFEFDVSHFSVSKYRPDDK